MLYDLNATHVLNKFIWAKLQEKNLLDPLDYGGVVPIVPTQQAPELNDLADAKPFIIYTYLLSSYDIDTWSNIEQVTYRIYSDDERKLRQITNYLTDLLKRFDWTAQEVNSWLDNQFASTDGDEYKFDFKFVQVVGMTSPEPAEQEGGRQNASVTIRIAYTHLENGAVSSLGKGMRA